MSPNNQGNEYWGEIPECPCHGNIVQLALVDRHKLRVASYRAPNHFAMWDCLSRPMFLFLVKTSNIIASEMFGTFSFVIRSDSFLSMEFSMTAIGGMF